MQTIHAFCTRLLHQFPFEADVAARFEVLDDAATSQLLNDLTLEVILQAAADPDSALGQALAVAITAAADITFKEVIAETIGKRDLVTAWIAARRRRAAGDRRTDAHLRARSRRHHRSTSKRNIFPPALIPQTEWPAVDRSC